MAPNRKRNDLQIFIALLFSPHGEVINKELKFSATRLHQLFPRLVCRYKNQSMPRSRCDMPCIGILHTELAQGLSNPVEGCYLLVVGQTYYF